ncbi:MAG: nuclear transport factor 2 family protein [Myxococcales bacterium]|nr:nuclear transport factor 2 family protein [Myxococcales bacterium]
MTATTTAGDRKPVELMRELFERVLNQRDADALVPYWAPDIVEEFPMETLRGRDAVRRYFAETFAALPDFEIKAKSIVGEGETVFVRWRATGTFSGAPWMGIEATGSRIQLDGIDCFTIRNGLVVSNFVVFDQLAFARQIGMLPKFRSAMDRAMTRAFNLRTKLTRRRR